jgi:serine/threonine-protein kinase
MANVVLQESAERGTVVGRLASDALRQSKAVSPAYKLVEVAQTPAQSGPVAVEERAKTSMGRYHVLGRLAAGGMGIVYRAYDPKLERQIALKVVRSKVSGENLSEGQIEERQLRMIREARSLARLMHPNIVAIYDVGTIDDDEIFVAMELVQGRELSEVIASPKCSIEDKIELFLGAGDGLAAAHAIGIVHRDFKPENCLCGADGRVRVLDFGLATAMDGTPAAQPPKERAHGIEASIRKKYGRKRQSGSNHSESSITSTVSSRGDSSSKLTVAGAVMGTPRYMAPEQALGEAATPRTDVFSFCLSFYEALCRHYPFSTKSSRRRLASIAAPNFRWPRGVPKWLRQLIVAGLSLDPQRRPEDMRQVVTEIRARRERARRRQRGLFSVIGAGAVACFAAWVHVHAGGVQGKPVATDCWEQATQVDSRWTAHQKKVLAASFGEADEASGPKAWAAITTLLDDWANRWRYAKAAQCVASYPEAEPALREYLNDTSFRASVTNVSGLKRSDADLAKNCLEQRLAQFTALTVGWTHLNANEVTRALALAEELEEPELCLDPREVLAMAPLAKDPRERARVQELRVLLRAVEMAVAQGHLPQADEQLHEILTRLKDISDPAIHAEVSSAQALLEYSQSGDLTQAGLFGDRATMQAIEAGHWRCAADAKLLLIFLRFYLLRDADFDIEAELRAAESWTIAGGSSSTMLRELSRQLGIFQATAGELEASLVHFHRAVRYARQVRHQESLALSRSLDDLALTYQNLGDHRNALNAAQEALRLREKFLAPGHAEIIRSQMVLARSLEVIGAYEEAKSLRDQANASCVGGREADARCAETALELAVIGEEKGEYARAEALALNVLNAGLTRLQLGDPENAPAAANVVPLLVARGRVRVAQQLAAQAVASIELEKDAPANALATTYVSQAYAEFAAENFGACRRALSRASKAFARAPFDDHRSVEAYFAAMFALHDGQSAIAQFEDAVRAAQPSGFGWSPDDRHSQLRYVQILLAQGDLEDAEVAIGKILGDMALDSTLALHLRVPFLEVLAQVKFARGDYARALEFVDEARSLFDPVEVLDNRLAGLDFLEARLTWETAASPADRARAIRLANRALQRYRDWDAGAGFAMARVEKWIRHPWGSNHGENPEFSIVW